MLPSNCTRCIGSRLMARIRTIKPEFWTDERVGECSVSARLLLIASLNFADDYGGLDRSAKQLKAQAFPYDAIDCEPLVLELVGVGLLIEYEVANRKYLHIKGFRKHQKVEKPAKPRIPLYEESLKCRVVLPDSSPTPTRLVAVSSLEGKGREGKGSKNCSAARTPPTDPSWLAEFQKYYPKRGGDPNWRGAARAGNARIADGHIPDEFFAGARRYAEFCRITGKIGTEFVKQAATFLGPGKPFLEPWDAPATKADVRLDANLTAAQEFMRRTEPKH
jgi:hypothetical protein